MTMGSPASGRLATPPARDHPPPGCGCPPGGTGACSGQTPSTGVGGAPGDTLWALWAPTALSPTADAAAESVASADDPSASGICPVTSFALILMALIALVAPVCSTTATASRMMAR